MNNSRKLKIISDGTSNGTALVDVETGQAISNVMSITWSIDVDTMLATATVKLTSIPTEIVMDDDRFTFVLPTQTSESDEG